MTAQTACCCPTNNQCCVLDEGDAGVGFPSGLQVSWSPLFSWVNPVCSLGSQDSAYFESDHCIQLGAWRSSENGCVEFDPRYQNGSGNTYSLWNAYFGCTQQPTYQEVIPTACDGRYPAAPSGYCFTPCAYCSCASRPANHFCPPNPNACDPLCGGGILGSSGCAACAGAGCPACFAYPDRYTKRVGVDCNCMWDCNDFKCEPVDPRACRDYCWQIPNDEYSPDRAAELSGGYCQTSIGNYSRSVDKCTHRKGSLSLVAAALVTGADGHKYSPSNYDNAGALVSGNVRADLVSTISRDAAAVEIDYVGKYQGVFRAQYVEHGDCVTGGGSTPVRGSTQYTAAGLLTGNMPLSQDEMNACNGMCGQTIQGGLPPLTTDCDSTTKCAVCSPCAVARVWIDIDERGGDISTAEMVIGQEYEIRELGSFCWGCFGAGAAPFVGQRFTATACLMVNCAPCLTNGQPTVFSDCAEGLVLPIYKHHFEVRGRGHLGSLWEKLVQNFDNGVWQYTENQTADTKRGYSITGYSAIKSGDSYVGGTQILGGCCNSPQYFGNHPDYPEQFVYEFGCTGCMSGLYTTYEYVPETTNETKRYYAIPSLWIRASVYVSEKATCFTDTITFVVPPYYDWDFLCCNHPCDPAPQLIEVYPQQVVGGCISTALDMGGSESHSSTAQSAARALRVGVGQDILSGLSLTPANAVYGSATPKHTFTVP